MMFVCTYVPVCMPVCVCVPACFMLMFVYVYVFVCVRMCAYVCMFVYVSMCVCVYVCDLKACNLDHETMALLHFLFSVVDCGFVKLKAYNPTSGIGKLNKYSCMV